MLGCKSKKYFRNKDENDQIYFPKLKTKMSEAYASHRVSI